MLDRFTGYKRLLALAALNGGLGSGLLGGGFGSGSGEPDEPGDPDEHGEPDQPGE